MLMYCGIDQRTPNAINKGTQRYKDLRRWRDTEQEKKKTNNAGKPDSPQILILFILKRTNPSMFGDAILLKVMWPWRLLRKCLLRDYGVQWCSVFCMSMAMRLNIASFPLRIYRDRNNLRESNCYWFPELTELSQNKFPSQCVSVNRQTTKRID